MSIQDQVTFLTGVDAEGNIAAESFWTWNGSSRRPDYTSNSSAQKYGDDHAGTPGGTVQFYFDPGSDWTAAEEQAFESSFALWSAVADIQFEETADADAAEVVLVRGTDHSAYTSQPTIPVPVGGDALGTPSFGAEISIDTRVPGWQELGDFSYSGGYAVSTVVHEVGHLIGLGHGGAYNGNVNEATQQFGPLDTRLWTIMSYIDPETADAAYFDSYPVSGTEWNNGVPTTWMPLDILAVQQLYGEATDTPLDGGQTFGFNCNITGDIQPFFDFTINTDPIITIWSAGTDNTLDLSGFDADSSVNLNPGTFSSCDGMVNNIAIAYDTIIETAIVGAGDDRIIGNDYDNLLDGGAGMDYLAGGDANDRILGRDGDDILYGDDENDFVFGGRGEDFLSGGDGTDILLAVLGEDVVAFHSGEGFDIVVGYTPGADGLDLTGVDEVAGFDDLTVVETGGGVLIGYDSGVFLLSGADLGSLDSGDFLFA